MSVQEQIERLQSLTVRFRDHLKSLDIDTTNIDSLQTSKLEGYVIELEKITKQISDENNNITTKDQIISFPPGYYTTEHKVQLNKAVKKSIIPENIKKGSSILGVEGNYSGIDLSKDNVTPQDVLQGISFHDKTGTLQKGTIMKTMDALSVFYDAITVDDNKVRYIYRFEEPHCFLPQSSLTILAPIAGFGDATPADVVEGKKFTSASGFKISGTAKLGGGGLPDVITPGDTPIIGDFSGKLIANKNAFEDSNILLTIPKTGKYRFYISVTAQGYDYSGQKPLISIRKNGNEISQQQVESDNVNAVKIEADCNTNDQITVWGRAIGTYSIVTVNVISAVACINWMIK